MRLVNPWRLRSNLLKLRSILGGGGPKLVRLVKVGEPRGLIVASSEIVLEVEARDGTKVTLEPELPMPFVWGWAIRVARRLGVPLISDIQPESFRFQVPVPGVR
jgi:hypothetical protein